jgi:hypothetical protein
VHHYCGGLGFPSRQRIITAYGFDAIKNSPRDRPDIMRAGHKVFVVFGESTRTVGRPSCRDFAFARVTTQIDELRVIKRARIIEHLTHQRATLLTAGG